MGRFLRLGTHPPEKRARTSARLLPRACSAPSQIIGSGLKAWKIPWQDPEKSVFVFSTRLWGERRLGKRHSDGQRSEVWVCRCELAIRLAASPVIIGLAPDWERLGLAIADVKSEDRQTGGPIESYGRYLNGRGRLPDDDDLGRAVAFFTARTASPPDEPLWRTPQRRRDTARAESLRPGASVGRRVGGDRSPWPVHPGRVGGTGGPGPRRAGPGGAVRFDPAARCADGPGHRGS